MPSGRAYGPEKSTSARRDELPAAGNAARGSSEASACAAAGAPAVPARPAAVRRRHEQRRARRGPL
eukprot:4646896-Prymnesium_polylepis.1